MDERRSISVFDHVEIGEEVSAPYHILKNKIVLGNADSSICYGAR